MVLQLAGVQPLAGQITGGAGRLFAVAVPMGAPQKMIGTPCNTCVGIGAPEPSGPHGPRPLNDVIGAPPGMFTKLAKSCKQSGPGRMIRAGLKPGQMMKLSIQLTSTPNRATCAPFTQATESEPCTRLS